MDGRIATLLLTFAVNIVSLYFITIILATVLGTQSNWKSVVPILDQFLMKQTGS